MTTVKNKANLNNVYFSEVNFDLQENSFTGIITSMSLKEPTIKMDKRNVDLEVLSAIDTSKRHTVIIIGNTGQVGDVQYIGATNLIVKLKQAYDKLDK